MANDQKSYNRVLFENMNHVEFKFVCESDVNTLAFAY